MTKCRIFRYNSRAILLGQCNTANKKKNCLGINIFLFTVPNLLVILFVGSNFLEVPKSMTFNLESGLSETKSKFSGFKSLFFFDM